MKLSKTLFGGIAGLALMAAFGSSAYGLTITINRTAGNYATSGGQAGGVGGGEFTITGEPSLTANYNALAQVGGGFETFCLEYGEHVSVPATYNASISSGAISGGPGAVPLGSGTTDYISIGTAYLYSQFAAGTLIGYNYGVGRSASAGALQAAFWFLEQEVTLTDSEIGGNIFLALLGISNNADADIATQRANSNGAFDVAVLNLGTAPGFPNQDQLVIFHPGNSVPDGGATLSLLGTALCGISLLRRKLA